METYSYSPYPDSQNSSSPSREIDCENQSWDEPISNYLVKFMCSYGGKIQPRPHDNQLSYIGGDTKILSVDRNIKFATFIKKLTNLCDYDVCFKYQLPGEDLDALISVTNDEDLEHMMVEYDRLCRGSLMPARLRLFLFKVDKESSGSRIESGVGKTEQEWFVEALNSVPKIPVVESDETGGVGNPDFLFGLDKGGVQSVVVTPAPVVNVVQVDSRVGVDAGSSKGEIQKQINELQRIQISGQEHILLAQQKSDVSDGVREYYTIPQVVENVAKANQPPQEVAVQMPVYWQNQSHMAGGGYQVAAASGAGAEQQVYIIPTRGMYQASTNFMQMSGQVNQPQVQTQPQAQAQTQVQVQGQVYYGAHRMVPDVYRDQQVYSGVPAPVGQTSQQPNIGIYAAAEGIGGRQPTEGGYAVSYDATGRQVYYAAAGPGGGVTPAYQVVSAAAAPMAQIGMANQEGKVAIAKPN